MLRHIVTFTLHRNADSNAALERLRSLCRSSPLLAQWRVEESLDNRKGSVIIQNTLLKEGVTIKKWKDQPAHKEVVDYMSKISDWVIADYTE